MVGRHGLVVLGRAEDNLAKKKPGTMVFEGEYAEPGATVRPVRDFPLQRQELDPILHILRIARLRDEFKFHDKLPHRETVLVSVHDA